MSPKRKAAGKKAAATRKRRAAGTKAAKTSVRKAAAKKSVVTRTIAKMEIKETPAAATAPQPAPAK